MRREGLAVAAVFALNGAIFGNWVARVPDAADRTHAHSGVLGLALLCIAGGAIAAMPVTGRLCGRLGSRRVVGVAAMANCLSLPPLGLAGTPLALAGALAVYGVSAGATDVAMNTNAVAAIRRAGRPLMPVFHGAFSLGGMLGAAAGGLAADHLGMPAHFLLAAAAGLVLLAIVYPRLPADQPAGGGPPAPGRRRRRARPDAALAVLGAVAFAVAFGEGAVGDWSALFLRDDLHTGAGLAAAGFTAFSVTMAAARFAGSAVLSRVGPATALAAGCGLAATGTLAVVTAATPIVALAGFAAIGAGLAYGFPIALAAAGAHHSGSGPAIGAVSTIGYTGFLAGPPLIGFAAQWAGLRIGLGLVAVAAAAGLALAVTRRRLLTEADPSRPSRPAR